VAHLGTKVNRRDFLSKLSEENVVRRAFARKISKSKTKSPLAAEPLGEIKSLALFGPEPRRGNALIFAEFRIFFCSDRGVGGLTTPYRDWTAWLAM
jgi:hypothetical protein